MSLDASILTTALEVAKILAREHPSEQIDRRRFGRHACRFKCELLHQGTDSFVEAIPVVTGIACRGNMHNRRNRFMIPRLPVLPEDLGHILPVTRREV